MELVSCYVKKIKDQKVKIIKKQIIKNLESAINSSQNQSYINTTKNYYQSIEDFNQFIANKATEIMQRRLREFIIGSIQR